MIRLYLYITAIAILEWVYIKNMPTRLIFKTVCLHAVYDIAAFSYFITERPCKCIYQSKMGFIKGFEEYIKKALEDSKRKKSK